MHVPFCHRRCPYCDFAVVTPEEGGPPDAFDRYVDALVDEIRMEEEFGSLSAVNLGGGTPSRLTLHQLDRILEALRGRFGVEVEAEVSLEANPEDWTRRHARAIAALGFTRVSLGVQSFDSVVLSELGRSHTEHQAKRSVEVSREAGFSVGLDLIYGSPAESMDSWERTVQTALDLAPDHISAYSLTVERGTELSRLVQAGAPAPDPDDQADKYEHLAAQAPGGGFVRYEISNYAQQGHACLYNLSTWGQGEYVGFGLGAHDHRTGVRSRNVRRLDRYLEDVEAGRRPIAGKEDVSGWDAELERLMLGLRRAAGVEAGRGGAKLVASEAGKRLVRAGVLSQEAGWLQVSQPLLTDEVTRAVLSVSP